MLSAFNFQIEWVISEVLCAWIQNIPLADAFTLYVHANQTRFHLWNVIY